MIKYVNYDIVFQEFPDEVTLAINLSLCPNACPGCHSSYLAGDIGDELTPTRLFSLIDDVYPNITCVALMGGDNDPDEVSRLLKMVKEHEVYDLNTGWYSGKNKLPDNFDPSAFDYVKVGPYIAERGPLKSKTTNQRLYRLSGGKMEDITFRFWKA